MNEPCPLQEWAKIKKELREASEAVLKRYGISWDDLNKLEVEAVAVMQDADQVQTEFGVVYKGFDKPVQYKARRSADDFAPTLFKRKLRLKKEENHA